jgi:16S rRNA (guanine527-N7)-methyltransferase
MSEKIFIEELKKLGIDITENQMIQLNRYYELLIEKNKVMDLTNIIEKESVYLKHFYDSLTLSSVCDLKRISNLCDIGTGAGFPGLVIKIIYPDIDVTLVDSLDKRIKFLNEVIEDLDLKKIKAIHIRAEEYAKNNRECFDIVTSRAVAKLSVLTELCIPLVKVEGYFIAMKANAEEEIKTIDKNLSLLNSKIDKILSFTLPVENSNRTLIRIKKEKNTDKKYPREFKEIKKKPL